VTATAQGIVLALALSGGAALAVHLYVESTWRAALVENRLLLLGLACVALAFRVPLTGGTFHGLEYEDAYVYSAAGHQLAEGGAGIPTPENPFLIRICVAGSVERPFKLATYSGHLTGYPTLIAAVSAFSGFSPRTAGDISVLFSCLAVVMVFLHTLALTSSRLAASLASLSLATTPVFAVYGSGSSSEPVSNAVVVAALIPFTWHLTHGGEVASKTRQLASWCALAFLLCVAVTIKRENVVPPIACLAALAPVFGRVPGNVARRLILALALPIAFAAGVLKIGSSIGSEIGEYNQFPFSVTGMKAFIPALAKAYLSFEWYSGTAILMAIGASFAVTTCKRGAVFALMLLGFVILYSAHVRGFYNLWEGYIAPYDTIRYGLNMAAPASILAGLGGLQLYRALVRSGPLGAGPRRAVISIAVCAYITASYRWTSALSFDARSDEQHQRILPTLSAVDLAAELGINTTIVTMEPLIAQIYGSPSSSVVDLPIMSLELLEEYADVGTRQEWVYLELATYADKASRARFAPQFELVESLKGERLVDEPAYSIWKLRMPRTRSRPADK